MTATQRLVVVGGGLAGLTAAITAADDGWSVTLLESRPRLGGATSSFPRAFEGGTLQVDNGQHVFLRCCTAYLALLRRLGVEGDTTLQRRLDVPVIDAADGVRARLARDPLPAPFHLTRSLLGYRLLSPLERLRVIYGALALRFVKRADPASDAQSFAAWLRSHHQTDRTIEALFDVFTVATLNAPAERASLALAAMVFQDGLLTRAAAADIGISRVPLGQLHGGAAQRVLEELGAEVRLRTRVDSIEPAHGGQWLVRAGSDAFEADAVVLAVPHEAAADLLPRAVPSAVADAAALRTLASAPILNVHVVFDRTVMTEAFVAAVGSPAQFVFDRTAPSGLTSGQYLAISVSAAHGLIDRPVAELRPLFLAELQKLLPAVRAAVVRDFFVTREKTATFDPVPGSRARRLPTLLAAPGIVLAGAWTDTGWPATMEGAVRSGLAAVSAIALSSSSVTGRAHLEPAGCESPGNEMTGPGVETAEEALA